jgi:hypothetical protein
VIHGDGGIPLVMRNFSALGHQSVTPEDAGSSPVAPDQDADAATPFQDRQTARSLRLLGLFAEGTAWEAQAMLSACQGGWVEFLVRGVT